MPQKSKSPKSKAFVKGAAKVLPHAFNLIGALPYVGGADAVLRGLASENEDDRYKATMLGTTMIAGNAIQDAATDYVFKDAAPYINAGVDTAWNVAGDPAMRSMIDDYNSPVWQNTEADKLAMFLAQYGKMLQPHAKKIIESKLYNKTLPPAMGLIGKVMGAPQEAIMPAVRAGIDAVIPPNNKRGIFTGQHGATGGPSFSKNPYAKK